ncbi:MAG: nucleotidyltransferase family protein [bacterium]|nr:nucleotidyltransferase family protein [bacterium]
MPHKKQTAGVILAAGTSKRFGQPKQLAKLDGKYLLEWVLDSALASRLSQVVLVVGHEHPKIMQALGSKINHPRLHVVVNDRYRQGQSGSLRVGLSNIQKAFESVMFILGDQPRLRSSTIDFLLKNFWNSEKNICVPVCRGIRGNPTIFSRILYADLMMIEGDIGAREIIRTNQEHILYVELDDALGFVDVDSRQDLEKLIIG